MRNHVLVLLVAAVSFWAAPVISGENETTSSVAADIDKSSLASLLSTGEWKVDVMQFAAPQRAIDIFNKSEKARRDDPWGMIKSSATAKEGERLKELAGFGLTDEERKEFVSLMKQVTVVKVDEEVLTVRSSHHGVFAIKAKGSAADFNDMAIDLQQLVVTTPYGVLENPTAVKSKGGAFGPWRGAHWTFTNLFVLTSLEFSLGQLENGRGFMHFKIAKPKRRDSILFFDVPKVRK